VAEPTPNLLAASRMRLQEALETARPGAFWRRLVLEPALWLRQIRMAPASGGGDFHRRVWWRHWRDLQLPFGCATRRIRYVITERARIRQRQSGPGLNQPLEASAIAGIRSVTQEPGSNQVSIKYDTVLTQEAQGSLNDQRIQQLLLFAARNNYNSGVRMDSVEVLTQAPDDSRVREALMYALAERHQSQGVRLKALDGLSGFVRQDPQVRDGVLRGPDRRHELRRSDAGPAAGRADENGQQRAIGADHGCRRRIRTCRSARRPGAMLAQMPEMD
jgi:hypothetical protein